MGKITFRTHLLTIACVITLSACSSVPPKYIATQSSLESANGKASNPIIFSLLNTHEPFETSYVTLLAQNSDTNEEPEEVNSETSSETTSLAEKLSDTSFTSPQLIIIEADFILFSKPNPYSSQVTNIQAGDGIYVLSSQDGWYEVETLKNQHGFINASEGEVSEDEIEVDDEKDDEVNQN